MRTAVLRPIVLAVLATALAALASLTPPLRRLELWAGDRQARLATRPHAFDDALIVAIDEESLERLRPIAGTWPFDRDLFARVTSYLSRAGARAIVYNILFADERAGDRELGDALARSASPVTLAAVATPDPLERSGDRDRVSRLGWPAARSDLPARRWQDVRLPRPELSAAGVGVANLVPDEDGIVRRVPMLHRIDDRLLPALHLAALFPKDPPAVGVESVESGRLLIGQRHWPVDRDGQVALVFAARPHEVPQVGFTRVANVALAGASDAELDRLVAGRTVFVGVTALLLGDGSVTPFGRVAGIVVLAQAFVALERGLVLEPRSWLFTGLLIVSALAWPVGARIVRPQSMTMLGLATVLGLGVAWALNAVLLAWWQQPTPLVLASVAGASAFTLFLADKIHALRAARQRLTTERVAAERSAALKGEFLAHVSHELRTPLTAIIGFSGTLAEEPSLDAHTRTIVQIVRRNGEQLLWLVNNLLDQARITAGQMTIDPRATSVADMIEQAIATLTGVPRRPGVELRTTTSDRVPSHLWVDGHRLRQIVINLGGNALKFTERGEVEIAVDWQDGRLEVAVRDSGPGIPAAALHRIFDAFEQADDHAARKGGTGLGLTISRNLASLMGGELTVDSTVGTGSTFRVRVPAPRVESLAVAVPGAAVAAVAAAEGALAGPAFLGLRALVADDSEDIRSFLQICLRQLGLEVTLVEDGKAAVEAALDERPAIVLIDVQMPEMSGPEAVRAMRHAGFSEIVVAMTAGSGDALESELLANGCDAVVFKPVTASWLTATVVRLLDRGPRAIAIGAKGAPG